MQKYRHGMVGIIAAIAVFAATVQVGADMASASGVMADIYVLVTQANADWAADPGNADKMKAAVAAENGAAEALSAYEALQAAGDDPEAAAAAEEKLMAIYESVQLAVAGREPDEPAPVEEGESIIDPGRDIVWNSPELQKIYAEFFLIKESASAEGGDDFAERYESDATPR